MTPGNIKSAALLFSQEELGGPLVEQETYPVCNAGANKLIALPSGDRVGIIIVNLSANDVWVALNPMNGTTSGIYVVPNGGLLNFNVRDDFTIPSRGFYAWSAGASTMYVLELIRFKYDPLGV